MDLFKNYNYRENFINNCFKKFLHNKDRIFDEMIPVHKKPCFGPSLPWTTTFTYWNQIKKFYQRYSQLLQIADCV